MEDIANLFHGFAVVVQPFNLVLMVVGIVLGVIVGVLPGLGGANGVAILLPLTFSMSPTSAIIMEAFGGIGVNATSPDELKRAVNAAMDSGKPTLINAVIDPAAGSESGRIGNLNPQSVLRKK